MPFEECTTHDEKKEVPPVKTKTRYVYCGGIERLPLRMVKCKCAADLAHIIDKRIKGHKVHIWPGCRKVSNRNDAATHDIHRYNDSGEDRAQVLLDNDMWCKLCNPHNEILPMTLRSESYPHRPGFVPGL